MPDPLPWVFQNSDFPAELESSERAESIAQVNTPGESVN